MIGARKLPLSQMMLVLIVIGIVGLIVELLLLDHTESFNQWIPLISLAAGLIATIAVWLAPSRTTLTAFKIIMFLFVAAGLLGVYFHFAGNVEWAHERDPDLSGLPLIWKALKGATPSLAPGALAQLGLLGLIFAWSNPTLSEAEPQTHSSENRNENETDDRTAGSSGISRLQHEGCGYCRYCRRRS